ncbi:MAG: hypothetical protein DRZ76_03040 [Candidatus Nealsonbacteria bacterium]|nr:MAG: hypothetical protein DRZ76_03040 [Candidatus Nealsonbacteria bacterium]
MSYPKQWQFLKKMAELGRIPSALLFSGQDPESIKSLALDFISLVNGEKVKEGHPDLYIVGPDEGGEIKISQIRELHAKLSLKSYSAPFKSIIINKAHTLNREAQSAFLKLLEEPKGSTIFILITEYPDFLLPTVISRVEHFKFPSRLPALTDFQKKMILEMQRIKKADLAARFQYARKLSENPENLREILEAWLRCLRGDLLAGKQDRKSVKVVKTLQTVNFLLSTTNVNPRLALEVLMMEL